MVKGEALDKKKALGNNFDVFFDVGGSERIVSMHHDSFHNLLYVATSEKVYVLDCEAWFESKASKATKTGSKEAGK